MKKNNNSRQEQVKELAEKLEKGIKELFNSEKYKEYLRKMSKFHNYSYNNILLMAMQNPDVSLVAGYAKWKKEFNRYVKKGEKGLKILAPYKKHIDVEIDKINEKTGLPILDEKGLPIKEVVKKEVVYFHVVTVFDVSQTEGEPLPTLAERLQGSVENYAKIIDTLKAVSPYPVSIKDIEFDEDTNGYCDFARRKIVIRDTLSEQQTVKTLIHEIAHAYLHENRESSMNTKEIEAESVAFIVSDYLGIDTSEYSFGYVASWSSDKEVTELKDSLNTIQKQASKIISKINEHSQELTMTQERQVSKEIENDFEMEI